MRPVTTLPDAEHQFAMLASQSGPAFEEHSVVLIDERNGEAHFR
jgi:hypothetical protein